MDAMFDAAIVGAGPAGAWCATRLAAAGLSVALIDGSHPREKPCGGGVTGRALAMAGQELRQCASGVRIARARFTQGSRTVEIALPAEPLRLGVVSRREFDQRLVSRATSAGATLIAERARTFERQGAAWRIQVSNTAIQARWLIGADGANSVVRKCVARAFARADISIACGYYVHGVTGDRIDIGFEEDPAGYLWAFPRHDHLAVGICAQADVASTATLMPLVDRWLDANVGDGRRERYSWPIPSLTVTALDAEVPSGDGWMLIGDAAGLVDPITREGIFFALQSAEIAADCLCRGSAGATDYAARVRAEIYDELRLAARLKARFYRSAFLSLLMTSLQRSAAIRDVMADLVAGDQPYHTLRSRLLKTMELRLMLDLFGLGRA
ncbi:MAG: NAD(P)/FAD-dependent oxidoreductase [Vicinamibacterales bacterium]